MAASFWSSINLVDSNIRLLRVIACEGKYITNNEFIEYSSDVFLWFLFDFLMKSVKLQNWGYIEIILKCLYL